MFVDINKFKRILIRRFSWNTRKHAQCNKSLDKKYSKLLKNELTYTIIQFFCFFFSRHSFSAAARPICTKFWRNVSCFPGQKMPRAIFEKLKNQVTTAKKHSQIFIPAVTFSFVVTKRLKIFEKSFQSLPLRCHSFQKMSLRQFRTVWFKISRGSMERQKDRFWRLLSRKP